MLTVRGRDTRPMSAAALHPTLSSGRSRFLRAVLLGAAAAAVVAPFSPWQLTVLAGWDVAALSIITEVWASVGRLGSTETAAVATLEDDTRTRTDVLLLGAAVASLVGIGNAFLKASEGDALWRPVLTGVAILTMALSWVLVHTIFVLRYAHLYYSEPIGGIDFKARDERPDYRDFAYTSFTVGMTFQVSDSDITDRSVRRVVLQHALLSFVFGAVILASTVNVVAGLLKL